MIAELNELISKNKKVIEESGWLPFGQKARDRKKSENEIRYLEDEIQAVQKYPDLDGIDIWIYNVAFHSYDQYMRLKKNDDKFKLVFNNCSQVYEIRTTIRNSLIGYTDRRFVTQYSRYRKLGAEAYEIENLTALDTNVPDKFRLRLRIFDKE